MRVVELDKSGESTKYLALLISGIVTSFASILLLVFVVVANTNLRATNPMNSPLLAKLYKDLESDKQNQELRFQIRELDDLARRAYFTSEDFIDYGVYALFGCMAIAVLTLKYSQQVKKAPPYPDSSDETRDLKKEGIQWRRNFTMGGLATTGFVLAIVVPWESPIDSPDFDELLASEATLGEGEEALSEERAAEIAANLPAVPVASREEHLKNWSTFLSTAAGHAGAAEPPTSWSKEDNVMWSAPTPLPGFNTPIIWGEKLIFAGGSATQLEIYCYDTQHGGELWRHKVDGIPGSPEEAPYVQGDTGYAAPGMVTDGTNVYAIFATGDLVAVSLAGERVWGRNLGVPDNHYGHASSLIIHGGTLLVQYDQNDGGHLFGIDLRHGAELWDSVREIGSSWATPALIEHEGQPQVILAAPGMVVAYDPSDGKELWSCEALAGAEVAGTPVYADGKIFVSADGARTYAIDVNTGAVLWDNRDDVSGVSTPLVVGELIYVGGADGGIAAINIQSGNEVWYEDTDDGFYASPILAGKHIYFMDRTGMMRIIRPGESYDEVAQVALGEKVVCTPIFLGKSMYLRGVENLYRIGN